MSNKLRFAVLFVVLQVASLFGGVAHAGGVSASDKEATKVVATCPAYWPEFNEPQSPLFKCWLLWDYIVDLTGDLYDHDFAGEEINAAEGKPFQFSCLYENKRWLTVLFPDGRIKKCDGLQKLPKHKMRHTDRCLVVPAKSGLDAAPEIFLAEDLSADTEIEGFRLRQTVDEALKTAEKKGASILSREEEMGEARRIKFSLERQNLDLIFANGIVKEIVIYVPSDKAAARAFIHSIFLRFGTRWMYVETSAGGVGEKWRSEDKRVFLEVIKEQLGPEEAYRLYQK